MKKNKRQIEPLSPEVKSAGLRILENAFGKYGDTGGTPTDLRKTLEQEIILQKPELEQDPDAVKSISTLLMARFFEIVADEPVTPRGAKYHEIIDRFMAESIEKYISSNTDKNN